MTTIRANDDGSVSAIEHSSIFDFYSGSTERNAIVSELMNWSDFIGKYSDFFTDYCFTCFTGPLTKCVYYVASVVSFSDVIREVGVAWEKSGDYMKERTFTTGEALSYQMYKLSQRCIDFFYRLMKINLFSSGIVELSLMKIVKDVTSSVEDVWNVKRADRAVASIEDATLKKLKIKENNVLFASALLDIAFHSFGLIALLSTTVVTGQMMLVVGGFSVAASLAKKCVTEERSDEESRQAALKINQMIAKGKLQAA